MTNLKLGAYNDAEDDCTAALKLNEKNVKAYLRRGAARSVSGNYLEAIEDYERALRLEPKNKDAKSEIVRMKGILGGRNRSQTSTCRTIFLTLARDSIADYSWRMEYTFGDISASHSGSIDDTSRAYRRFVFTSSLKKIISGGCWNSTELR